MTDTSTTAAAVVQQLTPNTLQQLGNIDNDTTNKLVIQIIHIYRYPIDSLDAYQHSTGTPYIPRDCTDNVSCYDVVISDGVNMRKCVASSKLIKKIELGRYSIGDIATIDHCYIRYEERKLADVGHVVMDEMTVVRHDDIIVNQADLIWPSKCHNREKALTPLITNKIYYLSPYNDDSLLFDKPAAHGTAADIVMDTNNDAKSNEEYITLYNDSNTVSLNNLVTNYDATMLQRSIVCKILSISKIVYFGKSKPQSTATFVNHINNIDNTQHSNPYLYELLVVDGTNDAAVKVAVWNTLVPLYYNALNVNDVIAIETYKVKQKDNAWEISCNPYNPASRITVLNDQMDRVADSLRTRLPADIQCNFVNIHTLQRCPDNWFFDFVGTLTYVSPRFRELSNKNEWKEYRWLLLADSSASINVPVKFYSNSQPHILYSLTVGQALMITNLHMFTHNTITTSVATKRNFNLVCNTFSRLYLIDDATMSTLPTQAADVTQHYDWHKSITDITQLQLNPSAYAWFTSLDAYTFAFSDVLTPLSRVSVLQDNICILQTKSALVQGYIRSIDFVQQDSSSQEASAAAAQSPAAVDPSTPAVKRSRRLRGVEPTPSRGILGRVAQFVQSSVAVLTGSPRATEQSEQADEQGNPAVYAIDHAMDTVATLTVQSLNGDATATIPVVVNPTPHATRTIPEDVLSNSSIAQTLLALYRVLPYNLTSSEEFQQLIGQAAPASSQSNKRSRTAPKQVPAQQVYDRVRALLVDRRAAIATQSYRQSYDNVQTVATSVFIM